MSNLSNVYNNIDTVLASNKLMYKYIAELEKKHNISLLEVVRHLNLVEDNMIKTETDLEGLEDNLEKIKTILEGEI